MSHVVWPMNLGAQVMTNFINEETISGKIERQRTVTKAVAKADNIEALSLTRTKLPEQTEAPRLSLRAWMSIGRWLDIVCEDVWSSFVGEKQWAGKMRKARLHYIAFRDFKTLCHLAQSYYDLSSRKWNNGGLIPLGQNVILLLKYQHGFECKYHFDWGSCGTLAYANEYACNQSFCIPAIL